jgi:hypothetical protein
MNTEVSMTTSREREAVAVRLFERAAAGETVDLAVLSAMERCVLGGPKQALFEQEVVRAWNEFGEKRRTKAVASNLAALRERGLLLDDAPERPGTSAWNVSPELGVVLAACERPTYVVATDVEGRQTRCLQFFAVGDIEQPVRGVVVEEPVALPPGTYKQLEKLGPLGWMTRYRLVSETVAAGILADVALVPRQDKDGTYPYNVRRFKHTDRGLVTEAGLSVIGSGASARVRLFKADPQNPDDVALVDADGLRALFDRVLTTGAW